MRRVNAVRRPGRGLGWGGGGPTLDLTGGTFSRASVGSYLTSATTLAAAAIDARRFEDRGDGRGPCLLIERSHKNEAPGQNFATGVWQAAVGTPTVTTGQAAPDGTTNAERVQIGAGVTSKYCLASTTGYWTASSWKKQTGGSGDVQCLMTLPNTPNVLTGLGTTWTRHKHVLSFASTNAFVPMDGRDQSGSGGLSAHAEDLTIWGCQLEAGAGALSLIIIGGNTCSPDLLTYSTAQFAPSFLTSGMSLSYCPARSSAEIIAGATTHLLVYRGASDFVRFRANAGRVDADLVCGGAVVASVPGLTFAAHQWLRIAFSPSAGILTVSDATSGSATGTGTGAAWPSGTLALGSDGSGTNAADGRFA